jgi:hypothetical protein
MRRLWLVLLILGSIALTQNLALSIEGTAYQHWCTSVRETQSC